MSNKSRKGSTRYLVAEAEPVDPEIEAEEAERIAKLEDALETPGRKGLEKLVGMVFDGRNKPEPAPKPDLDTGAKEAGTDLTLSTEHCAPTEREPLREPTAYEAAILYGLRDKPVYQGTVEPWRVDERRRRNKAARATRRRQRRRAA